MEFTGLICKGCITLGNACMRCEKCKQEVSELNQKLVKDLTSNEKKAIVRMLEVEEKLELEKARIKAIEANKVTMEKLADNEDFLLSLFKHGKTSCSDSDIDNGIKSDNNYSCKKCALIEILNNCNPEWKVSFSFDLEKI